ncbi:MAG TPA: hypothetical protein VJX31_06065 [Casimicrobiaceae bacterium]|jgi:hypothetical protein|nr:hypothetical protein [Steroidobacteraceae bacterium]HKP66173.1 hypothetical protein [Casimicrobiaceae bacterium]
MNARTALHALAILFATAAISADNGSVSGSDDKDTAQLPTRTACLTHCEASEGRCSREVRTARRDCERVAANGGRDVFTGRNSNGGYGIDYGQFCNYFANAELNCGSDYYSRGCQARLVQRHGICLDAMQNIAQLRYDCFRTERDANNQCRAELSDCKAACQ